MNFHFVGSDDTPHPYNASSATLGISLAVLQWMELVRGERVVMKPCNPFRVQMVRAEEHYCLQCFGIRWFDVIYAVSTPYRAELSAIKIRRCRVCGKESGS